MNNKKNQELINRKKIKIKKIENGFVISSEDEDYEDCDVCFFKTMDEVIEYIKKHYKQLKEDINVSKLTE